MDVERGVDLAGAVAACAHREMTTHGGRPADSEAALHSRCDVLRDVSVAIEPSAWARYAIPVTGGVDQMGVAVEAVRGDPGWRVHYETTPGPGYRIEVAPDDLLDEEWPRVFADSSGRIEVQQASAATPLAISPVADLGALVECLKGIPADEERRRDEHGGLSYGWFLTSMARRLCPSLAPRLEAEIPNDENTTRLCMHLPLGAGHAPMRVVAFKVQFVIRQPANAPFGFDLLAAGMAPGMPRYLATFEGAVHTTLELRPRPSTTPSSPTNRPCATRGRDLRP